MVAPTLYFVDICFYFLYRRWRSTPHPEHYQW